MKPFPPRSEWKGKNTYSPDCSDKEASPWGFDTFDRGTVGYAMLDWIINVRNFFHRKNDFIMVIYDI